MCFEAFQHGVSLGSAGCGTKHWPSGSGRRFAKVNRRRPEADLCFGAISLLAIYLTAIQWDSSLADKLRFTDPKEQFMEATYGAF
jgi:hypothetical protein